MIEAELPIVVAWHSSSESSGRRSDPSSTSSRTACRGASRWSTRRRPARTAAPGSAPGTTSRSSGGWCCAAGATTADHPISARYPLVEAGIAALFVLAALRFADEPRLLPAYLAFAGIGVALALIDLDVRAAAELDRAAVLPGARRSCSRSTATPQALLRAALGAAVLFVFYLVDRHGRGGCDGVRRREARRGDRRHDGVPLLGHAVERCVPRVPPRRGRRPAC